MSPPERVGLVEALGLAPLSLTARQAWLAVHGDGSTPKSRFGLSSLRQLRPRYAVPLWLGLRPRARRVPVTNLYNYRQPPPELGWSVCVTDVLDFRGGKNTYDSHNGTDFAIPPGTVVVAAAAGEVLRVSSEFHRGGRKILIDHGRGLVTTYNHLSRPLVRPGQQVRRGEAIALSGYSGIDALVGFPWTPPHVHFNVWLNGVYVDPFTPEREAGTSLWRSHNDPTPAKAGAPDEGEMEATRWDERAIDAILESCLHEESRREIADAPTLQQQAGAALLHVNYFPTRFATGISASDIYPAHYPREPRLDLPFRAEDYDGVDFGDR